MYVVRLLLDCHASVICYSKDCEEYLVVIGSVKSVICDLMLYSLLYGVVSVSVDLLVDTFSLFIVIQFLDSCKYVCYFLTAVLCLERSVRIMRTSAH